MKSEFEKYFKKNHADSFYSVDAALEMRGDDYIDFHAADLWKLWRHQQSKVDELQKQLIDQGQRFNDQSQRVKDLEHKSGELQKRVDASSKVLESIRKEIKHGHLSDDESQTLSSYANDLEQALKGEKQ